MKIRDREDILDVLAQCELHWHVRRIPDQKVDEMRDELHQHLREAARDGKPVETVVGEDVAACRDYWKRNGVPGARIAEMSVKLGRVALVSDRDLRRRRFLHRVRLATEVRART